MQATPGDAFWSNRIWLEMDSQQSAKELFSVPGCLHLQAMTERGGSVSRTPLPVIPLGFRRNPFGFVGGAHQGFLRLVDELSSNSASGTLSATTPPPACTYIMPSLSTAVRSTTARSTSSRSPN